MKPNRQSRRATSDTISADDYLAMSLRHSRDATEPRTPGQIAYEEDLRRRPDYETGTPRPPWPDLSNIARWSWERNPTPREWSRPRLKPEEETK